MIHCYSEFRANVLIRQYLNTLNFRNYWSYIVKPGRFYLLPKIHKQGCPGRPVISGCGTPTEKISAFVDHNVRPIVSEINSYIKDILMTFYTNWVALEISLRGRYCVL